MTLESDFAPGLVILGKYRVEGTIGAGGMGLVLRAHHLRLDGPVALKTLLPEWAHDPRIVERFAREAYAASRIKSEHVARVLDVETLDDGLPLIVMEYLEGNDLAAEVRSRGPLPLDEAAEFVLQACEALAEAHSLGIVHRDLKPANLFLTTRADGSRLVKVMDFGIAKALADTDSVSLTTTQDIVGSPLYTAPEQIRSSKDVDHRVDIWSLGVLLYEIVSGELPFDGASSSAVLAAVAADPPRALRDVLPSAPEPLAAIVEKALQKAPEDRYQNVAEFSAALSRLAPERARISTERIARITYRDSVIQDPRVTETSQLPEVDRTPPPSSRDPVHAETATASHSGRSVWLLVAASLLLVAVAAGVLVGRSSQPSADSEAPASAVSAAPATVDEIEPAGKKHPEEPETSSTRADESKDESEASSEARSPTPKMEADSLSKQQEAERPSGANAAPEPKKTAVAPRPPTSPRRSPSPVQKQPVRKQPEPSAEETSLDLFDRATESRK